MFKQIHIVRAIAVFIDALIFSLIAAIIIIFFSDNENIEKIFSISFSILMICKDIIGGRSFGKRICKLKVYLDNESNSRFLNIGRYLLRNVSLILGLGSIDIIVSIFNERNKRLGDYLAKTTVKKIQKNK